VQRGSNVLVVIAFSSVTHKIKVWICPSCVTRELEYRKRTLIE
jgi:hypothetical protein